MSTYSTGLDLSIIDGLKYYLYGSNNPNDDFSKRLRDKDASGAVVTVNASAFMGTGPGRYATPFRSEIVKNFFKPENSIPDGTYSLSQMLSLLQLSTDKLSFNIRQYEIDIYSGDYAQRAFLWGTETFKVTDASFSIAADTRTINSLTIAPQQENFDFDGGPGTGFINSVLEPIVDLYNIGRKVIADFLGPGKTITDYTAVDFVLDTVNYQSMLYSEVAWKAKLAWDDASPFLKQNKENPYTGYFEDDRTVVYGANDKDDVMVITNDINEVGIVYRGHGFTLVSGGGADTLSGSEKGDLLVAGKGDDLLSGGLGRDILEGQEGDDILVGGSGLDSRTINMKADHRSWDDGVSDTLKGGYGDDRYLIYHENGSSGNWYSSPESMLDVIDKIDERDGDGHGTISIQRHDPGIGDGKFHPENTTAEGHYVFNYNLPIGQVYHNSSAIAQFAAGYDEVTDILVTNLRDEDGNKIIFLNQYYPSYEPLVAIIGFKQGDFGITIEGWA